MKTLRSKEWFVFSTPSGVATVSHPSIWPRDLASVLWQMPFLTQPLQFTQYQCMETLESCYNSQQLMVPVGLPDVSRVAALKRLRYTQTAHIHAVNLHQAFRETYMFSFFLFS